MSIANSSHVRVMKSVLEVHSVHAGSLELVVDDGLGTGLNTGNVVSEGIHATLSWVDFDDFNKLGLTTFELLLPEGTLGLAILQHEGFWVLTRLEHLIDVFGLLVQVWCQSGLMHHPSWREPACESSSHMSSSFKIDYN